MLPLWEDAFGLTAHLGPDAILAFQPNWVRAPRHRNTSRLCDAVCELRAGAAKSSGKTARPRAAKRHEYGRRTRSGEGRTLAANYRRGLC